MIFEMVTLWQATSASTAAAPASTMDALSGYLSYGPLGLMVIGFLTGQLVPGRTYKRTEDENDRLRRLIEDKLLPLVEQNTAVTAEAIKVMGDLEPPPAPVRRRPAGT